MRYVETIVAGAGPVGLFCASELLRQGRECMLLERAASPSTHSKALAIMPGTMEIFEAAGISAPFACEANRISGVRFVTPRSSVFVPFEGIDSPYNFIAIVPQWKTEALLAARVRDLRGSVAFGHRLTGVRACPGGVEALVETDGREHIVRAKYLIGCDGISSTVRQHAGIAFEGTTYGGAALLADAVVATAVPADEARVHVYAGGVVTMFPMSDTLRRIVVIAPREALPQCADRDWLRARLTRAGYRDTEVEDVVWSNAFRVHRRIASAMRSGNVFLAGDSVHTHSPVGGQGMNIGLHDAWNLAQKLARVLSGDAPESLLDAYERERLPVAKMVLRTTDALTRALVHPHPFMRAARENIAPALAGLPMVYGPMIRRLSLTA